MNTISLGRSSLVGSQLCYGCWRIAGTWNPHEVTDERRLHGRQAVIAAFEAGYTLYDLADIYCDGVAESIFGEALKTVPAMREQVIIATKCGIRKKGDPDADAPYRYDFSADYIVRSCEESLRRLGIETIDLYQLHRPDYLADPEEIAKAFDHLIRAGKIRFMGVSNMRPSQVDMLQKACPHPIVSNQIEISLAKLEPFHDGTLDHCLTQKMTPMAWSPLGGGRLGAENAVDLSDRDHANRLRLRETLDGIARARGVTRAVVALSWLLRHPATIVPIVGSTQPARIADAVRSTQTTLTREEWYCLLEAGLGHRLP